jgi:hypothetical protein
MIKRYDEDKKESKIIFDDSSIQKINTIIENHNSFFVEFPLYEIKISKNSINKIFSLGNIGIEENILFSLRIKENESFTTNYSKILDLINTSQNKSYNNIFTNSDKNSNDNDSKKNTQKQIIRSNKNKPGTMKISKTGFNEFKTKIRNETINELNKINENEVYSDDEYDKIKLNNIINPQVITKEKRTNTSISLSPKFYGCIGENYDSIIKMWIFLYFSLIVFSIILFGYKIYFINNSIVNSVFVTSLIIDLLNIFIGIYGLYNLNKFIQLKEEFNNELKIFNYIIVFDILLSSFFLIYNYYFQNSYFMGNNFMNDSLYQYLYSFSLICQICCLYINLQMDKFYIENNMLLPLRESLL